MTLNELFKIAGIPLKEEYDAKKTNVEAETLSKLLKAQFHVPVDYRSNDDGSIAFTINNGYVVNDDKGNAGIVSVKNLSNAIDKTFREFRQKGWFFSQPAKGEFTIGVSQE